MSTEVTAEVTEVVQEKRKSRRGMVWTVLVVALAIVGYNNLDTIKPAANQAYDSLKSAASSVMPAGVESAPGKTATLEQARLAFTQGDLQTAQAAYKAFIARDSANLDARGELGNLYYLSGNYQEAAQTYYDLSKMLLDQKKIDLVPALLPVIGQVNPTLVEELMQKMAQIQQQAFEAQITQPRQG